MLRLLVWRNQHKYTCSIYQFIGCRTGMKMSNTTNRPLPLGAIEIEPLCRLSSYEASGKDSALQKSERAGAENKDIAINKCDHLDSVQRCGTDNHTKLDNIVGNLKESSCEKGFGGYVKNETGSCSHRIIGDSEQHKKHDDISEKSSALIKKQTVSGTALSRGKTKKTVLPSSLLKGVTDIVRKQVEPVNDLTSDKPTENTTHTGTKGQIRKQTTKYSTATVKLNEKSTKSLTLCKSAESKDTTRNKHRKFESKHSVAQGKTVAINISPDDGAKSQECARPKNHAAKTKLLDSSGKDKDEPNKSHINKPLSDNVIEDQMETDLTVGKASVQDCPLRNAKGRKTSHREHNIDVKDTKTMKISMNPKRSKNEHHLNFSKTKSINKELTKQTAIDIKVNNEIDLPFSEMDVCSLIDSVDEKEIDTYSNELLHIEPDIFGKKTPVRKDEVYSLSDLFSGELENRRKRELKKQKKMAKFGKNSSKRKTKAGTFDDEDDKNKEEKQKPRKPVPNYFVAIQIKDEKIKSGLKAVQEKVVSEEKKFAHAMNKLTTLHLTMLVLNLQTDEDMEKSKEAMDKAAEKLLSQHHEALTLHISGIGNFRNNVVFAKVKSEDQISMLTNIAEVVDECFVEKEIISPDQRGFKPHVTIMKLSSMKGPKKKGLRKIPEEFYSEFVDHDFGSESVSTLQLCSMHKRKDEHGYYQVEHKVEFTKESSTGFSFEMQSVVTGDEKANKSVESGEMTIETSRSLNDAGVMNKLCGETITVETEENVMEENKVTENEDKVNVSDLKTCDSIEDGSSKDADLLCNVSELNRDNDNNKLDIHVKDYAETCLPVDKYSKMDDSSQDINSEPVGSFIESFCSGTNSGTVSNFEDSLCSNTNLETVCDVEDSLCSVKNLNPVSNVKNSAFGDANLETASNVKERSLNDGNSETIGNVKESSLVDTKPENFSLLNDTSCVDTNLDTDSNVRDISLDNTKTVVVCDVDDSSCIGSNLETDSSAKNGSYIDTKSEMLSKVESNNDMDIDIPCNDIGTQNKN